MAGLLTQLLGHDQGMIAVILLRSLRRDIMRYNEENRFEDLQEETGWKLVHADVFRAPVGRFGPMVLSVFVGSGCQVWFIHAMVTGRCVM